jgi:hypothetical protein
VITRYSNVPFRVRLSPTLKRRLHALLAVRSIEYEPENVHAVHHRNVLERVVAAALGALLVAGQRGVDVELHVFARHQVTGQCLLIEPGGVIEREAADRGARASPRQRDEIVAGEENFADLCLPRVQRPEEDRIGIAAAEREPRLSQRMIRAAGSEGARRHARYIGGGENIEIGRCRLPGSCHANARVDEWSVEEGVGVRNSRQSAAAGSCERFGSFRFAHALELKRQRRGGVDSDGRGVPVDRYLDGEPFRQERGAGQDVFSGRCHPCTIEWHGTATDDDPPGNHIDGSVELQSVRQRADRQTDIVPEGNRVQTRGLALRVAFGVDDPLVIDAQVERQRLRFVRFRSHGHQQESEHHAMAEPASRLSAALRFVPRPHRTPVAIRREARRRRRV